MKRLLYRTLYASLLTATGLVFAVLAPKAARTQPPGALLDATAAIALGYAGTFVFVYACGAVWHLGRADACRYVHRRQRPDARRTIPGAVAEQQHAAAIAAVAAEPMQSQHIDDTAVMPVVTGVTWGFGPTTPVVDAPPKRTPPCRHGRKDVREPAGVAR